MTTTHGALDETATETTTEGHETADVAAGTETRTSLKDFLAAKNKKATEEKSVLAGVLKILGRRPEVRVFRNQVGKVFIPSREMLVDLFEGDVSKVNALANMMKLKGGFGATPRVISYGLPQGSPDIVGMLTHNGQWFCIECKRPGQRPTPEQIQFMKNLHRCGCFADWLDDPEYAVPYLEAAMHGHLSWRAEL